MPYLPATRKRVLSSVVTSTVIAVLFMMLTAASTSSPSLGSFLTFAFALDDPDAETISIFETDDLILMNPVESTTILMCIVFIGAIYELCFEFLKQRPEKFFQTVFGSIVEEIMLVGILAMVLIFVGSLGSLTQRWKAMIDNGVFVLLLMVVVFALFATISIFWTLRVLKSMRKFERSRMDIDPLLSSTEQLMKECKFLFRKTLAFHELTDAAYDDVLFTDYIQERCAETINSFFDLSWKSWGFLALFVAGNVIRIRSVVSSDDQHTAEGIALNVGTFIAIMGVFPAAMHILLHTMIRLRLVSLAKKQLNPETTVDIDTTHLLFFSSLGVTSSAFSAAILLFEWYIAFFYLNLVGLAFDEFGVISIVVVIGAMVPPLASLFLMPWTIINITILCSVGRDLDKNLAGMLKDAALHGIEFSLLATHVPGEDLATALSKGHVLKKESNKNKRGGGDGGVIITTDGVLDPSLVGGRNNKHHAYQRAGVGGNSAIRGNVLVIDDEWDTELTLNLRGDGDDFDGGSDLGSKEEKSKKRREGADSDDDDDDSSSSGGGGGNQKKRDSDDSTDSADRPLTYAIRDRNYLNDKESYHYTSRASRDAALEKKMKQRIASKQSDARIKKMADQLARGNLRGGSSDDDESSPRRGDVTTNNVSGNGRNWDSLRPMYLPDWRHNPITAREDELRERRAAIEAEKEKLARGNNYTSNTHFEL